MGDQKRLIAEYDLLLASSDYSGDFTKPLANVLAKMKASEAKITELGDEKSLKEAELKLSKVAVEDVDMEDAVEEEKKEEEEGEKKEKTDEEKKEEEEKKKKAEEKKKEAGKKKNPKKKKKKKKKK